MPIFRYTLKKILLSPSTWVVFILTLLILGLGWCLFPALIVSNFLPDFHWTSDIAKLVYLPLWKQVAFFGLIGLMLFMFIGIKSVQIFRDEIEDGTLLILVSKPISRTRIWLEKWLCFQLVVASYIFLSIFIPSLILLIPGVADVTLFNTMLPYMFILFGVGLLFQLIFTSVVLLISLVLNSKATIAIMVGLAALTNIFATVIDGIIIIPPQYFVASQATAVYHQVENKVSSPDFDWFKKEQSDTNYKTLIDDLMKHVYQTSITSVTYPDNYDPIQEQQIMNSIANGSSPAGYSPEQISDIKHVVAISNVFRQWQNQSYEEIMTGVGVGENHKDKNGSVQPGDNSVLYTVEDVYTQLNIKFSQDEISNFNNLVTQKKVLRYFNIFYQLSYLFNGIVNDSASLYTLPSAYQKNDDPYLISFNQNSNGSYTINSNSGTSKIIEFPVLIAMYVLVGLGLLTGSWYLFNRKDFA